MKGWGALQTSGRKGIADRGMTCGEDLGLPRLPCLKHLTLHSFTSSTVTLVHKSHTRDATSVHLSTCWFVQPRVKLSVHVSDPSVPQHMLDVMIYPSVSHPISLPGPDERHPPCAPSKRNLKQNPSCYNLL